MGDFRVTSSSSPHRLLKGPSEQQVPWLCVIRWLTWVYVMSGIIDDFAFLLLFSRVYIHINTVSPTYRMYQSFFITEKKRQKSILAHILHKYNITLGYKQKNSRFEYFQAQQADISPSLFSLLVIPRVLSHYD